MQKICFLLLIPFTLYSQNVEQEIEFLLDKKKYEQAEVIMEDHLLENPSDPKSIELLGDAYAYQGKWDEAIEQYEKLVDLNPDNAEFHYKYGGAMGMKALEVNKVTALFMIDDVENAFLKAIELDKKHINARWALVEYYVQLPGIIGGSVSKSLQYANELEAISKVDGYLAKGYIYEYDDEPELAETYYKKAIEKGGSLTCYEKLTAFYEKQDQPDQAIQNIEASQKKHQRNALHYQIGKVAAEYNVQLHKGEACLQLYLKNHTAEDGVPKAWAHFRLAQIYKHQNNKDLALNHIDQAISELPNIDVFREEKSQILKL
ncbi:tetratricopeptide repeat protein [Hanstruepera flava]|uniref:tetratricopeptide repeat protein n=1 Tax=Hanstruepera flava TaxID=2930218 RepID=UPI0020284DE6|nr:tetratricopeptide repeat protein [Hanstruepera flava]